MTNRPRTAGSTDRVDVLVVGAGPAGLATAISLARHGARPVVVERHPGTSIFPRATLVSTRTMECLRSWGLVDQIRRGGMNILPVMSVSATLTDPRHVMLSMGIPSGDDLRVRRDPACAHRTTSSRCWPATSARWAASWCSAPRWRASNRTSLVST